jgi:hypothetical protein
MNRSAGSSESFLWDAVSFFLKIGFVALLFRWSCGPLEPNPVAVHRQNCMRCVKIDSQLWEVDKLLDESRGYHSNSKSVCAVCKKGLHEVFEAHLMIDAAREAGCVGLEEYRAQADRANESFTSSVKWYRCD